MKKGIAYSLLFFTFLWFTTFPLLADEERGRDNGSEKKAVVRLGEWEFDFGGQVRLRGDFAKNQNFTDFALTPGHDEAQLLERTRLQASIENHSLNMEAFFQSQWYGRWGGIDRRSDFDLYQGYLQWEKIFALPVSLKAGRQEFFYGSAFFGRLNAVLRQTLDWAIGGARCATFYGTVDKKGPVHYTDNCNEIPPALKCQ